MLLSDICRLSVWRVHRA